MAKHTAYLGRNTHGERVFVTMELQDMAQSMTSVDHETVRKGVRISITGAVVAKGARQVTGAGQIRGDLRGIRADGSAWSSADVASLHKIWGEWHLNDMRAACAHMDQRRDLPYEVRKNDTCPKSRIPVRRVMALPGTSCRCHP